MRKAYRRKGERGRVAVWGSFLALVFGLASILTYTAVVKIADGIAPREWEDIWIFPGLACMIGLGALCFLWELRGPAKESSLPLIGRTYVLTVGPSYERFSKVRSPTVAAAGLCFGVAVLLGVLPALDLVPHDIPPLTDKTKRLMWAMAILPCLAAMLLGWAAVRPASLLIDSRGMTLPTISKTQVNWGDIKEIRASAARNAGMDPLNDRIEIHLRDGAARLKRRVFWLEPWNRLGASPTDVLDAIDRFRPSTVPIHDWRRIENERRT